MKDETVATSGKWATKIPYFEYSEEFSDNETPWSGHKLFGYNLVHNLKPQLIVELGSWKGTSFYAFCQAVKDDNLNTKLYAIDTWQGDDHAGFYGQSVFNNFTSLLKKYYSKEDAHYIRKTFAAAREEFADNSIDLLHIDGLHTYEAVSEDFNTWLPKLKKDGIVLFHDITETKGTFGVHKFWGEIKSKYPYTLQFNHSHGLGILFMSEEKHTVVAEQFDLTKTQCLEYSYQATKGDLFKAGYLVRELGDIKNSRYWKLKETVKGLLMKK